jgi:succinate-acetate transporter protein
VVRVRGAHLAGWYGDASPGEYLFPFAAMFGGLAQFAAGMWAYKAHDTLATAMHGMWGSFWLAYGILNLLVASGAITLRSGKFFELGFWFIALAAITLVGAVAALAENVALSSVLWTLAVGAAFLAIGYLVDSSTWMHTAGWVLIVSAGLAWYTASAMLLEATFRRVVLPVGKPRLSANVPGRVVFRPIEYPAGQPGVKVGQ